MYLISYYIHTTYVHFDKNYVFHTTPYVDSDEKFQMFCYYSKNFNLPVMIKDSNNNNAIFGIYNGFSGIKELSGKYTLKSTDTIYTYGLDNKSTIPAGIKIKQNDICKYSINEIVYIVSKF